MSKDLLNICNATTITPYRIIQQGTLLASDGIITEIRQGDIEVSDALEIDAEGKFVAPGFIDIHVHGGGGHDFMDSSGRDYQRIGLNLINYRNKSNHHEEN